MGSLVDPLATVGILSIGDMGVGIARLLMANNFQAITNVSDRSPATQARATQNGIPLVATDVDLCNQSDYILSIVPPHDAIATAQRIISACQDPGFNRQRAHTLYFLDLNAISPRSARAIDDLVTRSGAAIRLIDGGIIGGPPKPSTVPAEQNETPPTWTRPSIPLSGPHELLSTSSPNGAALASTLNTDHLGPEIGRASGVKMCFASLSKGATALAIQAFTTAAALDALPALRGYMAKHNPHTLAAAERGLPGMCPKAYRWVHEMREIADTFEHEGGFGAAENSFRSVAGVYELVADGTELGGEKVGERKRGLTAEEVAREVGEGIRRRKEKVE